MQEIKVDQTLWAHSMLPEGIVERWFITNGATISAGERIAEVRIEMRCTTSSRRRAGGQRSSQQ